MSELTPSAFRRFIRDCRSLRDQTLAALSDVEFALRGGHLLYAVDFTELYAYCRPSETADELRIFRDDEQVVSEAVQQFVLDELFHRTRPLIMLQPYSMELEGFVHKIRQQAYHRASSDVRAAMHELRELDRDPEFRVISKIVHDRELSGRSLTNDQAHLILQYMEKTAPRLLRLAEAKDRHPRERLIRLLTNVEFQDIEEHINVRINLDNLRITHWTELLSEREHESDRQRTEEANYHDATAAAMVEWINQEALNDDTRLVLVTRTPAMHRAYSKPVAATGQQGGTTGWLRHPRVWSVLYSVPDESLLDRSRRMHSLIESMNLLINSYDEQSDRLDGESSSRMAQFIDVIRQHWHECTALIAMTHSFDDILTAQVGHGDSIASRALAVVRLATDDATFRGMLKERLIELMGVIQFNYQLSSALSSRPSGVRVNVTGQQGDEMQVLASSLYWMDYVLDISSPERSAGLDRLIPGQPVDLQNMLKVLLVEVERHGTYRLLLAVAHLLGALNAWHLAENYCDSAIAHVQRQRGDHAAEALFFRSLCLRMQEPPTEQRYRLALTSINEALEQQQRFRDVTLDDRARFLREKASVIFEWNRLGFDSAGLAADGRPSVEEAVRLCGTALGMARDRRLVAHIWNNLCYHFLSVEGLRDLGRARTYYDKLLDVAGFLLDDLDNIPLDILDTMVWGGKVLGHAFESRAEFDRGVERLRLAVEREEFSAVDRRIVMRHLADL